MTLVFSRTILDELNRAPRRFRMTLDAVPNEHREFLESSSEVELLAERYVARGVVGPAMLEDALHIAAATLAGADLLVSWNFKHIVNDRRIRLVSAVNRELGHESPNICTPWRLLEDDS